ncbi:MAG: LAGLIDADG family homing endonuclease [Candidatus Wildermuthbacteria bacterium]|nr:LAGLIDADG family homing endonuclease [Candidatus Wildermuthbacteria bacterium]
MGSRLNINLAYIAGFLDGDGSLMLQVKKRKDGVAKIRFMPTICFYQDSRHKHTLYWIQKILGIGYLSQRNDKITELRINGYRQVRDILKNLLPYIKFKKVQAQALYRACTLLSSTKYALFSKRELSFLVSCILDIQRENYVTKRKKTKGELFQMLDLTP